MSATIELRNCRTARTRQFHLGLDWSHLATFPILGGAFGLHTLIKYRLVLPALLQALFSTILVFIVLRYYWDLPAMVADRRIWALLAVDFCLMFYLSSRVAGWSVNKHLRSGWSLTEADPRSPALMDTPIRAQLIPEPIAMPSIREAA